VRAIQSLNHYLGGGETLDQFLEQYPSITRELPIGRVARTTNPKMTLGARPRFLRAGLLTLLFSYSSRVHRNRSARPNAF